MSFSESPVGAYTGSFAFSLRRDIRVQLRALNSFSPLRSTKPFFLLQFRAPAGRRTDRNMASDTSTIVGPPLKGPEKEAEASFSIAGADADDVRLAEMGYLPELNRKFSLLSCLAVGFSVCGYPWAGLCWG